MATSTDNSPMNTVKENSQQLIFDLLNEYAAYSSSDPLTSENQVIADFERGHFQLVRFEWERDVLKHNTVFHFDIKPDGKIWIQVNRTDIDIAAELVERGIDKTNIVIGFQPPRYRPYTGYAVA